jgi:hypothetical protein
LVRRADAASVLNKNNRPKRAVVGIRAETGALVEKLTPQCDDSRALPKA